MKNEDLITYISKLNERNLARKQISGFTIWAVLGIISYLLLDLCDKAPGIYYSSEGTKAITLIIITIILNVLSFLITLLLFFAITFSSQRKTRFRPKNNVKFAFPSTIFLSVVQLVILVFNIKVSTLYYINNYYVNIFNHQIPYSFIFLGVACIFFINILSSFIIRYNENKKIRLDENYIFKLDPIQNHTIQKMMLITLIIISGIVLYLHYIMFCKIDFSLNPTTTSLILKINYDIIGILLLFSLTPTILLSDSRDSWLEKLERDFYFNNLTESEIIEKIDLEYIGMDVIKWFSKNIENLNSHSSEIISMMEEIEGVINKSIDINKPIPKNEKQKEEYAQNLTFDFVSKYNSYIDDSYIFLKLVESMLKSYLLEKDEELIVINQVNELVANVNKLIDKKKEISKRVNS